LTQRSNDPRLSLPAPEPYRTRWFLPTTGMKRQRAKTIADPTCSSSGPSTRNGRASTREYF
jgi:hypothetical protein